MEHQRFNPRTAGARGTSRKRTLQVFDPKTVLGQQKLTESVRKEARKRQAAVGDGGYSDAEDDTEKEVLGDTTDQHRSKRARVAQSDRDGHSAGEVRKGDKGIPSSLTGEALIKALDNILKTKDDLVVARILITHDSAVAAHYDMNDPLQTKAKEQEEHIVAKIISAHNAATVYEPTDPIYNKADALASSKKRITDGLYCPNFPYNRVIIQRAMSCINNIAQYEGYNTVYERKLYDPASVSFLPVFEHPESDIPAVYEKHEDEDEEYEPPETMEGVLQQWEYERSHRASLDRSSFQCSEMSSRNEE
ncbi:hypothetical protein LTR85_010119 [Meristemomyces frigidus]|nr:hypothetical protein LTR85_010119 [Meristemomyces frigidus]